jgi:hypothetical protein
MGSGCEGTLLSTRKHFVRVSAPQSDPGERLAHDAVRDEAVMSAEPTPVGMTSTTSTPTSSSRLAISRHAQ